MARGVVLGQQYNTIVFLLSGVVRKGGVKAKCGWWGVERWEREGWARAQRGRWER